MTKNNVACSFCGRKKADTQLLIAGLDAHICDKCIEQAHGIVVEEVLKQEERELSDSVLLHKPKEIKDFLNQYVSGKYAAKRELYVVEYNYYNSYILQVTEA